MAIKTELHLGGSLPSRLALPAKPKRRRRYRLATRDVVRGVMVFGALTIVFQLFYPSGKILPSVQVGNYDLTGQSLADATTALDARYQNAKITLVAGNKKITSTLAQVGIDVDSKASAQAAMHYPWYERILPFSSLFIMVGRDASAQAHFDADRLSYFAAQSSQTAYVAPVDATVAFKNGGVVLVPAKDSDIYSADLIAKAVKAANFLPNTTVKLKPAHKPAARQAKDVQGVLSKANDAASMALAVTLDGKDIGVDKSTIGGWLDFTNDTSGQLALTLKPDTVKAYLNQIQSGIYKAAGTTTIEVVDGRVTNRSTGATGRGIDMDKAVGLLTAAVLKSEKATVDLPIVQTQPAVVYKRSYSNSSAGLAALLNSLVQAKGDYAIAVAEINGRNANVNGNKQYTSASTYKLFVAYGVFQSINSGQLHWTDSVGGTSASDCFDRMIVNSDNNCAEALGDAVGWDTVNSMMASLGLTNTHVEKGNELTTANDLAFYLYKLQNGSLLNSSDRNRLIADMEKQIYRDGIPAGTGVTVADKVGFLYALIHDAGIVYGPKGPYVMVIMTNNSSWSQLADAARQINNYLKQ